MSLSKEQIAYYWEHGFVHLPGVFPAERMAAARIRYDQLIAEGPRAGGPTPSQEPEVAKGRAGIPPSATTVRKFERLVPYEPLFLELASTPALVEAVAALIGRPVQVWHDQSQLKPPRVGSAKPPHQDNSYHRIEPADLTVTAWVAIDEATLENGCMRFLPGSHHHGLVDHVPLPGQEHNLSPANIDLSTEVAVPCRAGDVALFHTLVLHHSLPNRTDQWRRSFICHYIHPKAQSPTDHTRLPRIQVSI
ncbi:MAG: phytanoyl-CoA dioxygenase family protein [Candidatus Latescibacteria bacterium]|nr:phytanoyl-CoA dioxygenase family protein [Candidatus Latescibacterota bacterium]